MPAVETAAVSRLHERQSYDPADFPVPGGREEEWRFTPLRRLRGLHTDGPLGDGKVGVVASAAPGVTIEYREHGDPGLGTAYVPADRVSARAFAEFREATVISVAADVESETPTFVTFSGESTEGAAFGHTLIDVRPNARATVVLEYTGSATYADNVEFVVGEGGALSVISLQTWADDAVHLSHHHAQLGKDARFAHTAVTLGGSVVRLAPSVRYAAPDCYSGSRSKRSERTRRANARSASSTSWHRRRGC